ncbi:MAG TPA: FG-GAP-like repeat-containing protein, partial [Pyrinomonadaceae bacterium]
MRIRPPHNHQTVAIFILGTLLLTAACRSSGQLPAKASKEYNEVVRAFYIGLAALQVGDDVRADAKLNEVTQLLPAEPAGWANWGLLALRQRNFDPAAERLERARSLAPDNDQIYYLLGLLESSRGRSAEAGAALRKAVEINPQNLLASFKLAEEIERQGAENSESEYQQLIQKMLVVQPDNLAILLELGRIAAKRGDGETLQRVLGKLAEHSAGWPAEVQQQLTSVQTAAAGGDVRQAATQMTFLRNVLVRVLQYRMDLSAIKPPPGEEAVPFIHFLKLESPTFGPAAADMGLTFAFEPVSALNHGQWDWIGAVSLSSTGGPTIVVASGRDVRLSSGASFSFPSGSPPGFDGVLAVDFSYDFKTDLVLAGTNGVRLLRQESPEAFTDVTSQTKLPASVLNASYLGAWAADIEADGDLDIVLGSRTGVVPSILRNNGDGTFLEIHPFNAVSGLQGFAWADLDADGDPDAALIDGSGKLEVFSNERQAQFRERSLP